MSVDLFNWDFFKYIRLILYPSNIIPNKEIESLNELESVIKKGYIGIIFDVDQTLIEYGNINISNKTIDIIKTLSSKYSCCILSNYPNKVSKIDRLNSISNTLNLPIVLSPEKKPSPIAFKNALATLKMDKSQVVMVGDRLFTDILGANHFGIYSVLIRPINIWKDPFLMVTIPRLIEFIYYKIVKLLIRRDK